jgi:hypothetical protein
MAGSSSSGNLVMLGLFAVLLTCGAVAVHLHPELIDSVKNWFSHMIRLPR